jgi:hypothetical protein
MKKITVILMLTMLMSICVFSTPKDKSKTKDKPNVHNKNVPNEYMKKAIAKSKSLPRKYNDRTQATIQKQLHPRKPNQPKSLRPF